MRREYALETIASATFHIALSESLEDRARKLNQAGVGALDSFHLASAEASKADFFCTCDDSFLKKAKKEIKGKTRAVSPLELAEEIERWHSRQDR